VSGFVLKGALISFSPSLIPLPIPNVIIFQYNPEKMTHTWSQPEPAGGGGAAGGAGGAAGGGGGQETSNPFGVMGMPGEQFSFTVQMDSNEDIASGNPVTGAIATVSGLYSRIAAMEMLLYPSGTTNPLVGAVTAAISSALGGGSSGPTRTIPDSTVPVTLFIWGPGRIVPVRVTQLTITEMLYDEVLNPIHAEVQMTLRVLTPAELVAAQSDNDILGNLATIAYTYTLTLRQALALANLANAASSIIGMIPH
jgi:hypothetical protein